MFAGMHPISCLRRHQQSRKRRPGRIHVSLLWQEIKLQEDHCVEVLKELNLPEGWHVSWNCSRDKKGEHNTAGEWGRQAGGRMPFWGAGHAPLSGKKPCPFIPLSSARL